MNGIAMRIKSFFSRLLFGAPIEDKVEAPVDRTELEAAEKKVAEARARMSQSTMDLQHMSNNGLRDLRERTTQIRPRIDKSAPHSA